MITLENYRDSSEEHKDFSFIGEVVNVVNVSYIGGRLSVYINHNKVFSTDCAGDDFSVELNND